MYATLWFIYSDTWDVLPKKNHEMCFDAGNVGPYCFFTSSGIMPSKRTQPVSRDLVRIIREKSRLEAVDAPIDEHLKAVTNDQNKAVEIYLRACVLRLEQSL